MTVTSPVGGFVIGMMISGVGVTPPGGVSLRGGALPIEQIPPTCATAAE